MDGLQAYGTSTSCVLELLPTSTFHLMAVKTSKGVVVTTEPLAEGCEDGVLRVGYSLWRALAPVSARDTGGPIAVSVGLLRSHTEKWKRETSLLPSVLCWAVLGEDVQVSYRPHEI
jgi:hypothetical protein